MALLDVATKMEFGHLGLNTAVGKREKQVWREELLPGPEVGEPLTAHII